MRPYGLYPLRRFGSYLRGRYTPTSIALEWPEKPDRVDFLNRLVAANRGSDYLEIGCAGDLCFSRVQAPRKVGVDPSRGGTVRATSREFFAANADTFDLIFVDGLHHHEQVVEDVRSSLEALRPGGVVVLHDCLPLTCKAHYREQSQLVWNGDVWKALVEVRTWPEVDTATCLIDHGLGIVVPRPNTDRLDLGATGAADLTFDALAAGYPTLLRTIDFEAGLRFACHGHRD